MTPRFKRNLKIVTAVHVGVVVCILLGAVVRNLFRKKEPVMIPVDIMFAAPAEALPAPSDPVAPPPPPPPPEEIKLPDPKPKPKPKPKKKAIKVNPTVINKKIEPKRPPKPLPSEEEIRKLMGAETTPRTPKVTPTEDQWCLALIKRCLYDAWNQPSATEAGGAEAEVTIRLGPDGTLTSRQLTKSSGNGVMDQSVMAAVNAVPKIPGLSPAFIKRRGTVTIAFNIRD